MKEKDAKIGGELKVETLPAKTATQASKEGEETKFLIILNNNI